MKKDLNIPHLKSFSCFLLILIFYSSFNSLKAQKPGLCGSYRVNKKALTKALEFEKDNPLRLQSLQPYLLRVYFHICRFNDGSHPGATKADLDNEFATLKSDFASDNICFFYAGVNFINNTELDTINVNEIGDLTSFTPYMVAGCINIFYVEEINGTNSADGGGIGGFGLFGIGCLVAKSNIDTGHSISHEVGHFLGLLHTFEESTGHENIDGSNCLISADLVCDTKADPFFSKNEECFSVSGCTYNGNCEDPTGRTDYSPPFTNMMAYWTLFLTDLGCFPNVSFSPEQFQRIRTFLVINPAIISCESPENEIFVFATDVSEGKYIKSGIYTLTSGVPVNLHGTVEAALGSQSVDLLPGFHAYPSTGGKVTIKATDCDYNTAANKMIAGTDIKVKNYFENRRVKVYPNPVTSSVTIEFAIENEESILLELYNMAGIKVKQTSFNHLRVGKQKIELNLSNVLPGLYYLKLHLNKEQINTKIIVVR